MVQNELVKIKLGIADNVGNKVRLKSKQGRKQIVVRDGVIESTYPSIFTVKLDIQNDITENLNNLFDNLLQNKL